MRAHDGAQSDEDDEQTPNKAEKGDKLKKAALRLAKKAGLKAEDIK